MLLPPQVMQSMAGAMGSQMAGAPQALATQGAPPPSAGGMLPMQSILLFLAGAGFNEVAYAIDRLQGGARKAAGSQGAVPPSGAGPLGIPQALQMLSGAQPPQAGPPQMAPGGQPGPMGPGGPQNPAAALGPNPLQALAMLQLKSRMAMGGQ